MQRTVGSLLLFSLVAMAASAHAQGTSVPLPLAPEVARPSGSQASAKLPSNWRILSNEPDPLTGQGLRQAITLPRAAPVIDRKSVTTGLVMRCSNIVKGVPDPALIVIFTSLSGVGHFKNFSGRYRFDEGPVHDFPAQSIIGKDHARAIALPRYIDVSDVPALAKYLPPGPVDPGIEIAGAARLRVEFNFKSAGVIFLDFNVAGATQAINALGCQ